MLKTFILAITHPLTHSTGPRGNRPSPHFISPSKLTPVLGVCFHFLNTHSIFAHVTPLKDDLVIISAYVFFALFDDSYLVFYLLSNNEQIFVECMLEWMNSSLLCVRSYSVRIQRSYKAIKLFVVSENWLLPGYSLGRSTTINEFGETQILIGSFQLPPSLPPSLPSSFSPFSFSFSLFLSLLWKYSGQFLSNIED